MHSDLDFKSIIITGTDRGLGKYLKNKLSTEYKIIGSSRKVIRENPFYLDFRHYVSIHRYLRNVFKDSSPGYLIQNIGLCASDHPFNFTPLKINEIYEINFASPFFLIKKYLEITKFKGKVIVISSVASKPVDFSGSLGFYGGAKYALERILDDVRKQTGAWIKVLNPPPLEPGEELSPTEVHTGDDSRYQLEMVTTLDWQPPSIVLDQIKTLLL